MSSQSVCDEAVWGKLHSAICADRSERFLHYINRACLERILVVQMRKKKGNVSLAVSSTIRALKRIESGSNDLQEHAAKMDKVFFEKLVKADTFMLRGNDKQNGRPLAWVRDGKITQRIWKLRRGSAKEHAFIRHEMFFYQQGLARMLAEPSFGNSGFEPMIIYDFVSSDIGQIRCIHTFLISMKVFVPNDTHLLKLLTVDILYY